MFRETAKTKRYFKLAPKCQIADCTKYVHDRGSLNADGFYCKAHAEVRGNTHDAR